jgi:hypothetical protein
MTPEETERLASEMGWEGHATGMQARPGLLSIAGMKERAYDLVRQGSSYLPTAGGVVGGIVGGVLGTAASPVGTAAGALMGSAVGGAAGEVARQGELHAYGLDKGDPQPTAGKRALNVFDQAMVQAGSEAVGQGAGRLLRPTLSKTIAKLYYAGGIGAHDNGALESVFEAIAKMEKLAGNKTTTVGSFLQLLDTTKKSIGSEVDSSMMSNVMRNGKPIPLGDAEIVPIKVADPLNALTKSHPSEAEMNPTKLKMFKQRALLYQKPRSFKWLTDRRIVLNNHLSGLYEKTPGEQALYLFEHPDLEADRVEADAIRDTIYPEMDRAAGKPPGTTAVLQQRRGSIMSLSKTVDKHLNKLQAKSKAAAGAPVFERSNISSYESTSGRPGLSIHRLTALVHAPNPERAANKKVASAFGHTVGSKVAKGLSSPVGVEIMSLPLRVLASPEAPEPDEDDQPSLKDLRNQVEQRRKTAAPPGPQSSAKPYTHYYDEKSGTIIPA